MLRILIEKELKSLIQSPKFVATFGICTLLILLSVIIGIQEYKVSVAQYETATQLVDQQISEATSSYQLYHKLYREPTPMQVFISGVNSDVGRLSNISSYQEIKLIKSSYSDNPLFAVFRFLDFTFIVQVVLSLFAILFTYDAVNGERESGTLKLALSNAVPRGKYLFAKFVGSWLGLTIPLLIPMLIGLLLLILFRVPVDEMEWLKLIALLGVSILYFTCFITLGLLVSSLTRRSSVSFLVLLVLWIGLVLIVPRGATMAAGQLVEVPAVASIESQKDRFRTDRFSQWMVDFQDNWKTRTARAENMNPDERRNFYQKNRAAWQEEDDNSRALIEVDVAEYNRKLNETLRNAKSQQERLAFVLSRFSPASAFKLMAMNLGGTNTSIKKLFEDQMSTYRESFVNYSERKQKEDREERRRQAQQGNPTSFGTSSEPVDSSDMPRFTQPEETISEIVRRSIIDFGLLSVFAIVGFAGAFLAFVRYDIR